MSTTCACTVVYKEETHHYNQQISYRRLTELVATKLLIRTIRTVNMTITNFHSQNAHRPVSTQKVI